MNVKERRVYINPTTEFFIPRSELARWTGEIGVEYARDVAQGHTSDIEPDDVNKAFFARLPDNLHLGPDINPRQFVREVFHTAQECLYEARHDRLGIFGRELHPRNETVFTPAEDVARSLFYSVSPNVDPVLAFEHRRQLAVALIVAQFKARDMRFNIDAKMSGVLDLFNEELWAKDKVGNTEYIDIFTLNDNKTGAIILPPVNRIDTLLDSGFENCHIKYRKERVRYCQAKRGMSTIPVIFDARRKPDLARVLKVLRKMAGQKKNFADINTLVEDDVGLSFAPQDPDIYESHNKKFMEVSFQVLKEYYGDELVIEEDDGTQSTNGDPNPLFKRRKVYLPGTPTAFEFFYYEAENYELYHGEARRLNPTTGKLEFGRAHEIFKLGKDLIALEVLFPEKHYGLNIKRIVYERQEILARMIINQNRIIDIDEFVDNHTATLAPR